MLLKEFVGINLECMHVLLLFKILYCKKQSLVLIHQVNGIKQVVYVSPNSSIQM